MPLILLNLYSYTPVPLNTCTPKHTCTFTPTHLYFYIPLHLYPSSCILAHLYICPCTTASPYTCTCIHLYSCTWGILVGKVQCLFPNQHLLKSMLQLVYASVSYYLTIYMMKVCKGNLNFYSRCLGLNFRDS